MRNVEGLTIKKFKYYHIIDNLEVANEGLQRIDAKIVKTSNPQVSLHPETKAGRGEKASTTQMVCNIPDKDVCRFDSGG